MGGMRRLIASAVLLSLMFSTGLPLVGTTTAFAAGGPSSSYRYLKGIGKVQYKMFEDTSRGIVLHNFNGDGYIDVGYGTGGHCVPGAECAGNQTKGRAEIFLNDRKGRLNLKTKQAFAGKTLSWKLGEALHVAIAYDPKKNGKSTLADITGDGRADWLLFNSRNTMYPKNTPIIQGKGKKLKVGPRKSPLITYHSGTLADIDKDGDLDLVYSAGSTHISYNNGRGKFSCKNIIKGIGFVDYPPYKSCYDQMDWKQPTLRPNRGWSWSALVIDLNKDGLPEVITANGNDVGPDLIDNKPQHSGKIFVFKNTGGKLGTFKKVQSLPGPGKWPDQSGRKFSVWAADTQAADFDGDGDLDGLFYHECGDFCSGTNPIVILKNLGNGKVKRWQIINASPARGSYKGSNVNKLCGAPQVVDLNGDKRPDLVGNYSHNYNGSMQDAYKQIWMNKGNGKFTRLTKNIFSTVRGNSKKAKIVALHANKDKKIDWLVIWSDGTYGTLIAR